MQSPVGFKWLNFKVTAVFTILLLVLNFIVISDTAEGVETPGESPRIIYHNIDPAGDDHGFGDYIYPQHAVFEPGKGLFDIKEFTISKHSDYYVFTFEFKTITDPWQGRYNFSHQLIHLYFDTGEGGKYDLFRPGANVEFSRESLWNYHLRLSGWWLRFMEPDDDPQDLIRDLDIDAESSPWDVEEGIVSRYENNIRVVLPREYIPDDLTGSNFYLLVGSFDPFGEDYFRDIQPEKSNWYFASSKVENPEKAPRVIDWFYPEAGIQEDILGDFLQSKPVLKPLSITEPEIPAQPVLSSDLRKIYVLLNLILGLGILTAIIYSTIKK